VILVSVLGAIVGGGLGWLVSRNLSRFTGTCPIMCNPKVAVPYFALLGLLIASQYAG
jgi:ABC-type proline/glycine betaine transport system permease subunit